MTGWLVRAVRVWFRVDLEFLSPRVFVVASTFDNCALYHRRIDGFASANRPASLATALPMGALRSPASTSVAGCKMISREIHAFLADE